MIPILRLALVSACSWGLLSGCRKAVEKPAALHPASVEKITLGYLVKQPDEPWFQYEWQGAERAAAQYQFRLIKLGVTDGEKMDAALDNLAAQGAQGFVVCAPDVRLGPAVAFKATQNNLKFITVDDQFVSADQKLMTDVTYLGMSARTIGEQAGVALYEEMTKRGWPMDETALCAVTFEELDTARTRTDGAIARLVAAGFPAARVFKAAQKTTDVPGSFDAVNVLLTQHPEAKHWLICGMNDTAVLGAVRAMEGRGFAARDIIGVGINGTDCIDELRKREPTGFFGSIFVSARDEGFRTTEMLYHWVKSGVVPPPDTRTSGVLITRANFEEILRRDGIIQ